MRYFVSGLSLVLIAVIAGAGFAARPDENIVACETDRAYVRDATPREAALACAGIADALAFFESYGFDTDVAFDVTVLEHVHSGSDEDLSIPVLGQFIPDQNRVFLTALESQREMARKNAIYKQPFDPRQFREVAAHEAAHVLAEHNFGMEEPSRLVHEYIAYIVQFATMEPVRRARILSTFDAVPFESPTDLNAVVYGFAPNAFAVKSFLYFEIQHDRQAYLADVMTNDLEGAEMSLSYMN